MNRRDFIKLGSAAIATSGLMNVSQSAHALSIPTGDYKALVCIFLLGGNDGFNMVVPTSDFDYNEYAASRQNMAIAKADLLPVSPLSHGGSSFGFHPQLSELQGLFNNGKVAVMSNVGNLVEPITRQQFLDHSKPLPDQLFSHNDQQDQWRYVDPQVQKSGLGGRVMDLAVANNQDPLLTGIAIDGRTNWLSSQLNLDLSIGRNGFDQYGYVAPDKSWTQNRRAAFKELLSNNYNDPFTDEFKGLQSRTMDLVERVGAQIDTVPEFTTIKPEGSLATKLEMVAKLIAIRAELGMERQVFYVGMGGFDTHDAHINTQQQLFTELSQSMNYFYDVTTELGVQNNVTSFTSSEFGRTLTSNGDGTDHAWGNHQLVMGGAVRGGDIYGQVPSLEIDGPDDANNDGRIIPTTSVEQFMVSPLRWFGLTDSELNSVMPNLSSFDANAVDFML
ncbi:hypothetical protein TQ33_1934 [Kangiella geojedonensis]|uniref:Tat pathway signal protein n=2 Tax=Kangiella geojedonensis TaxID=914150 RepID=A0A0F6RD08_9GAMM|nr:hypothetical protein TQ33_1934 [Kangiella geojedonensis]